MTCKGIPTIKCPLNSPTTQGNIAAKKKHTADQLLKVMNSVFPFLKFTLETEEDFQEAGGYIPTLDMEYRMEEDGSLNHRFFEKPMNTKFCVHSESAMSME